MIRNDRGRFAANLCNVSMLIYMTWLLLPAVQTTLHALTGAAAIALFGVGVLFDGETLRSRLISFLARVLMMGLLPLSLFFFLDRGGGYLPAYLAQQGMFWFPLLWCAYARERGDDRLYRMVKPLMIALMVITTLTTIGWLVQGMTAGDKVYAYSRSLGSGEPNREVYLEELMRRNIGGYDFIYASVLALPITFFAAGASRGFKRIGFAALYMIQLAMIALSQYTYALLFAAGITALELLAALLRAVFKKLSVGASMLWTLPLLATVWLARVPLITWLSGMVAGLGFQNAAYSLSQLLAMLTGGAVDAGTRLDAYETALRGFAASPIFGSLLGGVKTLGMHSDLLDMLSGAGIAGTAVFAFGAWVVGRGSEKGLIRCQAMPQLALQRVVLLLCLLFGTVFYSREIPLVLCMSAAFLIRAPESETA